MRNPVHSVQGLLKKGFRAEIPREKTTVHATCHSGNRYGRDTQPVLSEHSDG